MMEGFESQKVISVGGLNSNVNHLQLSDYEPGSAVELINFESSLYGGYRRLSGYAPYITNEPEVDSTGAEGRIFVVAFLGNTAMTARKQQGSNTYTFYISSGTAWVKQTLPFTLSSTGVTRIRFAVFNFNGTEKIIFVDGVNYATIFDGTNWTQVKSTNTGADFANAGGDQAIDTPTYVEVFENHIFLADDHLIVHSSPLSDYDWTAASGAGQLPCGFIVNQIKTFRDTLIIFGLNNIKKIEVSSSTFVLNEITANIGCLAPDSVLEVNGSLVFLSQDGFRPIQGTDRINDIELESISRKIQPLITESFITNSLNELCSVLIRGKSQVRFFLSSDSVSQSDTYGFIGCLRTSNSGVGWEWGRIKGIRASCATSKYIGATEVVLHGDYNGKVYQQESGNTFDGSAVTAIYSTPFLDFQNTGARKTMSRIKLFVKPEGKVHLTSQLKYDWLDPDKLNPDAYSYIVGTTATTSIYGEAIWDSSIYTNTPVPMLLTNVEGSGHSVQVTMSSSDTNPPYTIQGMLFEFNMEGRK